MSNIGIIKEQCYKKYFPFCCSWLILFKFFCFGEKEEIFRIAKKKYNQNSSDILVVLKHKSFIFPRYLQILRKWVFKGFKKPYK